MIACMHIWSDSSAGTLVRLGSFSGSLTRGHVVLSCFSGFSSGFLLGLGNSM